MVSAILYTYTYTYMYTFYEVCGIVTHLPYLIRNYSPIYPQGEQPLRPVRLFTWWVNTPQSNHHYHQSYPTCSLRINFYTDIPIVDICSRLSKVFRISREAKERNILVVPMRLTLMTHQQIQKYHKFSIANQYLCLAKTATIISIPFHSCVRQHKLQPLIKHYIYIPLVTGTMNMFIIQTISLATEHVNPTNHIH